MVNNTHLVNTYQKATLAFSKKKFFKVTCKDENHNGFKYITGLNILKEEFAKTGSCVSGGLYFSNKKNIHNFYGYGVNLREVSVPQGAQVVQDDDKYRTDKLILKTKHKLYTVQTQKLLKLKITDDYLSCYLEHTKDNKKVIQDFVIKYLHLLQKYNISKLYYKHQKLFMYIIDNNYLKLSRLHELADITYDPSLRGIMYGLYKERNIQETNKTLDRTKIYYALYQSVSTNFQEEHTKNISIKFTTKSKLFERYSSYYACPSSYIIEVTVPSDSDCITEKADFYVSNNLNIGTCYPLYSYETVQKFPEVVNKIEDKQRYWYFKEYMINTKDTIDDMKKVFTKYSIKNIQLHHNEYVRLIKNEDRFIWLSSNNIINSYNNI